MHRSVKIAFFWIFMAFVALIVATVITVRHATDQKISVVEPDYYEKGLNYEKAIQAQKQMKAEGYDFSGDMLAPGFVFKKGSNPINVRFGKKGQSIAGAEVELVLERSATDEFNVYLSLPPDNKGNYSGQLNIPEEGDWLLTIKGKDQDRVFRKTLNISVGR